MALLITGSCQIFGWGHNHRGQLGGIEGAKVRMPTSCDAIASLKPLQVAGGEQTLFIVTTDGKVRTAATIKRNERSEVLLFIIVEIAIMILALTVWYKCT